MHAYLIQPHSMSVARRRGITTVVLLTMKPYTLISHVKVRVNHRRSTKLATDCQLRREGTEMTRVERTERDGRGERKARSTWKCGGTSYVSSDETAL